MKRIGFTVIVVAAFAACQNDRPFPPGPNALIQDANHNTGNAFFFWLPPVVNQQAPATQVFSAHLSPVVTITNLCNGALVRTFSGADLSVSDSSYHVNWQTAQDNLNSACTYRVTVTVGTKLMGFADVDVVDSGRELKNVNTTEFIPLLDDRTLPLQFFIGVGSQCVRTGSDCGEGTAHPWQCMLRFPHRPAPVADQRDRQVQYQRHDRHLSGRDCVGSRSRHPGSPADFPI
ncbi:MAG: hypothetical protein DMD59_03865 [Gemmatimonadetes bacterium]|nr:MAG: hypothetical protein DMD59_03865 [Gemmatimonadota bacterium]